MSGICELDAETRSGEVRDDDDGIMVRVGWKCSIKRVCVCDKDDEFFPESSDSAHSTRPARCASRNMCTHTQKAFCSKNNAAGTHRQCTQEKIVGKAKNSDGTRSTPAKVGKPHDRLQRIEHCQCGHHTHRQLPAIQHQVHTQWGRIWTSRPTQPWHTRLDNRYKRDNVQDDLVSKPRL